MHNTNFLPDILDITIYRGQILFGPIFSTISGSILWHLEKTYMSFNSSFPIVKCSIDTWNNHWLHLWNIFQLEGCFAWDVFVTDVQ